MLDVAQGNAELMLDGLGSALPHLQADRLRAVFVTSAERSPLLPDVPTARELGLGDFHPMAWYGIFAPKATPPAVIDKLTADMKKVVEDPAFKKKAEEQGAAADYMNPQQLGAMVKTEYANWAQVVKSSKIEAE